MAQIPIFSMLLMLWLAGRASADGGDDFANNLASDLGPIIALFGERVVMQFMSQAMGITDCILLAVAPIGAITTVVSAIRVAGPPWLKSFIGRARENLSAAEIEVMSSTSKEACELWNGHSVVRCPGSADIYQFICLLPMGYDLEALSKPQARIRCEKLQDIAGEKDDDLLRYLETSGPRYAWRSFNEFLEPLSTRANDIYQRGASYYTSVLLHLNLWKGRERTLVSSRSSDLEAANHQDQSSISTQMEIDMPESQKPAFRTNRIRPIPRRRSDKTDPSKRDLDGIKDWDKGEKDKEIVVVVDRSDESAPNLLFNCHERVRRGEIYLAAAFGVILQLGALVYFGFITYDPPIKGQFFLKDGKGIVDYAFPCAAGGTVLLVLGLFICAWVVEKSTTETCYEAPNHQMFVVWLQKDHTVNDQVFKPYAIYPTSRRDYITMSRRNIKRSGQLEEVGQKMANVPIVDNRNTTAQRDNKGAQEPIWDWRLEQITFFGALIALIGFISQFIGMRGLNWTASVVQLGITFAVTMIRVIVRRGLGKSPSRTRLLSNTELDWFSLTFGDLATAPWALSEDKPPSASENVALKDEKSSEWRILTGGSQIYHPLQKPDLDSKKARKSSAAHKMMVTRERLCTLSKWKSTVSEEAALLSRALEAVAQTFLEKLPDTKLLWTIPASYKESREHIFMKLKKSDGKWHIKDQRIEAILSLWLYSTPPARDPDIDMCAKWRVFGSSDLWPRLLRDLRWWMPDLIPEIFERTMSDSMVPKEKDPDGKLWPTVVGFTSEPTSDVDGSGETGDTTNEPQDTTNSEEHYLFVGSEDPWHRFYSRDLLFAFIRSVAKMPSTTSESARSERPIGHSKTTEGWEQMKLENGTISSLARKLEKIGFGTLSDIYFDLIMPLSLEQKLTNVKNVLDEAIEQAQQHERSRQWKKLVSTCSSLLDFAQQFNPDKEASGPMAVAACMEFLFRLRHEAGLQRQEGRREEELITQLEILEEKFTSMEGEWGGSAVFRGIKNSLSESSGGYATTFDMLIGTTPDATRTFPESFNISNEHQELVQTNNSGGTVYWTIEELEKVDSFGWSPLHYAANWQLKNIRIAFSEKGGLLNLRDLMGRTPLHHACLIGNEVAVDLLLDHDAPIETAGNDGITAVHCAVLGGNVDILGKLVEKVKSGRQKHTRKSILHVDRNERHPIHWAAIKGDFGLVSLLKDDINRTDRFGWTCAHLAVIYENARLLQDIIEEFAIDLNLGDNRSRTPLHLAVENKSLPAAAAHVDAQDGSTPLHQSSITRLLIEKGADINATDIDGRTALFIAAVNGVTAIAAFLIESGANIAIAASGKRTPLHMAVQHEDIVRLLLAQDANVGAADVEGRTPLYLAAADGAADVAALLIFRGANVKTAAKDGRTALHVAVKHKDIAEMLLGRGADINAVDIEGQTPLYLAATDGTAEVAALLMDNGAHVATAAGDGRTALHMALSRGEDGLEIAKKLLGFDPDEKRENPYANAVAQDGATPLHIAAECGPPEAVEMLLHLGANIDQKEGYQQTALLIAMYQEQWDIVKLLLDAGANIKADDRVGYTPLLGAVMGDQEHIVDRLLSAGAGIDAVDEDGYSSIHLAIDHSGINTLSLLLAAGANINAVSKLNNQTPLHFAVRRGNGEMVQILLENGADTDRLNHLGFSPLQYAVYRGDLQIVKVFVRHDKRSGATTRKAVLQRGKDGDTPMHTLCLLTRFAGVEQTMCEMLKELLSVTPKSDTINDTTDGGSTPLDLAYYMRDRYPEFVGMLKEEGAKLS